jgi:hypothetical protein
MDYSTTAVMKFYSLSGTVCAEAPVPDWYVRGLDWSPLAGNHALLPAGMSKYWVGIVILNGAEVPLAQMVKNCTVTDLKISSSAGWEPGMVTEKLHIMFK